MSSSPSGVNSSSPLETASLGTQVLLKWAEWNRQHGSIKAMRIAVFRKKGVRLVVHEQGSVCAVLKLADEKPRIREFREWSQQFYVVAAKLVQHGWEKVSDVQGEGSHAH